MLQSTGSQRVRHDLATEQEPTGHWDGEGEDAPSCTWSPGWGLGFRTSKHPVPPSSGLDNQSWEEPKGGDSVWGRSLAYHHGLASLILAPGCGSMNAGGGGGWGEHHLSFLKRKSKLFNSSPASTSSLQSSATLKPTRSSRNTVLTVVAPSLTCLQKLPTTSASPPELPDSRNFLRSLLNTQRPQSHTQQPSGATKHSQGFLRISQLMAKPSDAQRAQAT